MREHLEALGEILSAAERIGLKFSSVKSFVGYPSLKLLGRMISDDGLSVLHDRTKAIRELRRPRTISELYTVLGLFGYYRPFIPGYARLMEPLTRLTKGLAYRKTDKGTYRLVRKKDNGDEEEILDPKKTDIEWGDEQDGAFEGGKDRLDGPPTIGYPDPTKPYFLYVDTSHRGSAAILHQVFEVDKSRARASPPPPSRPTRYTRRSRSDCPTTRSSAASSSASSKGKSYARTS